MAAKIPDSTSEKAGAQGAEVTTVPGKIEGTVIAIDEHGNLVTDITAEELAGAPTDEQVSIVCDEHGTLGIHRADHDQPEMTFIAMMGDGGDLQLTIVGDSAHMMLGVKVGEKVVVKW